MIALETIRDKINAITYDLRAEVIISMFLLYYDKEKNVIIIDNKGQFTRPFRKDVLNAQILDYEEERVLKVITSRDGLYDTLPEGFFHNLRNDKAHKEVTEMRENYRLQKKEEEHARRFFSPFENEFFLRALEQENQEKDFLFEINSGKPLDFFYDFWGLEKNIPPELMTKLMAMLPYAYKMVGNIELTAHCLSYILQEPVQVTRLGYKEQSDNKEEINLGDCRLGLDMISGSAYMDYSLYLEFCIGPLQNSSLIEYIHGAGRDIFIRVFYEYFIPMEIDVRTTLLLKEEDEQFDFSKHQPLLGYTTRI